MITNITIAMTAPPKRRMSADERRETVLVVAVAEFARTGLQGTSTEKIATGADISHPYLFRLFGTKKELFLACVEPLLREPDAACSREAAEAAREGDRLDGDGPRVRRPARRPRDAPAAAADLRGVRGPGGPRGREPRLRRALALVARLSGAPEEDVRGFFATGMLLNMAAAMDLPQIAGDPGWALAHLREEAGAGGDQPA